MIVCVITIKYHSSNHSPTTVPQDKEPRSAQTSTYIYRKPCRKSALDTGLGIQKFCVCICMMYMIVCMCMHVCTCVVSWYFCCVYKMPYHCCLLVHITTNCHEYQPPCFVNQSINQSINHHHHHPPNGTEIQTTVSMTSTNCCHQHQHDHHHHKVKANAAEEELMEVEK